MNIKELIKSKGYKQTLSPFTQKEIKENWYYKVTHDLPHCETNERPPSFFIKYYKMTFNGYYSERIEVELVAEKRVWWRLSAYSLTVDEFKENIDYIENKLANMWRSLYV
jgi:hypothetical protein